MDTRLFARVGAGAFVALALTMTALQLREERAEPQVEIITAWEADDDPLPAQLRACSAMGELALTSPDCRAAWSHKRRRFLGVEGEASAPAVDASEAPPQASEPQPAKGL
ncbi:MAG: hypothetical protein A3J40_06715 [Erythrobacter sp. RIFCSPHIGHO2_12_FULL_63_10]|nr:MAG: hypothetical protein A3J40_06715 [Erythrobacter sp. RIFCSPHIGHO2_12_FULL_63_10]